jgi:hypothetical protein
VRTTAILYVLLASLAPACSGEDDGCSSASECIDGDPCTDDRCTDGACSYLPIQDCCTRHQDCGDPGRPVCDVAQNRCVECLRDTDCDPPMICRPGTNTCDTEIECIRPADCDDQDACTADTCSPHGRCQNDPLPGCPWALGERCREDAQCQTGLCLTEEEYGLPEGFCAQTCTLPDGDCGPDTACLHVVPGVQPLCLPICRDSNECRGGRGYMCLAILSLAGGVCVPHCESNDDCPVTGECNVWRGMCNSPPGMATHGVACTTIGDCRGLCLTEAQGGWPRGICTAFCAPDRTDCQGTSRCVVPAYTKLFGVPVCLPLYSSGVGCRMGYGPGPATDLASMESVTVCQPDCREQDCQITVCNEFSGLCGHTSLGDGVTGDTCDAQTPCLGWCMRSMPGGYCTTPCSDADPACPADDVCIKEGDNSVCAAACSSDTDCREADGYVCRQPEGACWTP